MKQDEIAKKKTEKKEKETKPDQSQPSCLRANPSSSVRTLPNPNLQQIVDFACHQNGEFTLQPQIQQQIVLCTPLQHPNQITKEWNSSMSYHYRIIALKNNVQKCYGCGQGFPDCYRIFPNNLIVRHRDRRLKGMSSTS